MYDFNIVAIAFSVFGIIILALVLFTLFTARGYIKIACCVSIIVCLFIPYIIQSSYELSGKISKLLFLRHATGEIQLIDSPMKIPRNADPKKYCQRFVDGNNNHIEFIAIREDGSYCGYYSGFYERKTIFIPYENLPNGKIKYWATPNSIVIGDLSDKK